MEDSPLPVTASVAGILTFVAAILASIYVRYNTLHNGNMELKNALNSVLSTIKETRKVMTQVAPSSDPASVELQQLNRDLFETELAICQNCYSAYGVPLLLDHFSRLLDSDRDLPLDFGPNVDLDHELDLALDFARKHRARARDFFRGYAREFAPQSTVIISRVAASTLSLCTAFAVVLRFGETQTLMRWYMVRKDVLELMQKREQLRSQLLRAQMLALTSSVSALEKRENTVDNHLSALKREVGIIRRLATDISVSMNRPTDAEEGSPPRWTDD